MKCYFSALDILFNNHYKNDIKYSIESVSVLTSVNRISYQNIISKNNIPIFNNSAMDGYAMNVNFKLLSNFKKKKFFIIDTVIAGEYCEFNNLDYYFVIEIMTGSRLPSIFNSIIKIEDICISKLSNKIILINRNSNLCENIRLIGEDFIKSDIILNKGEIISPSHLLVLSSFGIKKLNVVLNPKVYLISTGNELVNSNEHELSSKSSYIYNSTHLYIINFFKLLGINVCFLGSMHDSIDEFINILKPILSNNINSLIISTGAVSKGISDFIPMALNKLGVKTLFHGIKIKPGKPIIFGKYKNNNYFFGLPGNPISSIIGIRFFTYPFLRHILGLPQEKPKKAYLVNDYTIIRKTDVFLKTYSFIQDGFFYTKIIKSQESFKISSMVESNSFAFVQKHEVIKKNNLLNIFFNNPTFY